MQRKHKLAEKYNPKEFEDELYKNWRSILRDWTNEFRCLFYDGGI